MSDKLEQTGPLRVRRYGDSGPMVIVLHGGPGAAGSAHKLACALADRFSVIEPFQRRSTEDDTLTVACHIEDLHSLIGIVSPGKPPAIVGESWGAMLALAYAAAHPGFVGPVCCVGCGTFDPASRKVAINTRRERIHRYIAGHPQFSGDLDLSLDDRIMKWHDMTDHYHPLEFTTNAEFEPFDMKGYSETWRDMIRCQEEGIYPATFSKVTSPVILLHGSYDPHPGRMIRDTLQKYMPHLEYREFDRCGHNPIIEKYARDSFLTFLQDWLSAKSEMA